MNYLGFGKAITMTDEEICKAVNDEMECMGIKEITEIVLEICSKSDDQEPGAFRRAKPICQITYIGREMYKLGFIYAMYNYNEALKELLTEMQTKKEARESKRKGVSGIAEA